MVDAGNLNKSQFTTLYRGVTDRNGDSSMFSMRTGSMGQSWSTSRDTAERFAMFDEDGYETPGHVVTAQVHNRHIMKSAERNTIPGIHSDRSYEAEQPLRKGAIVHVRGVDGIDEGGTSKAWPKSDIKSVFGKRQTGRA